MSAIHAEQSLSEDQRLVFNIEHMMQEANSGASFEQYFRWASLREITEVCAHLSVVGLAEVAGIVEKAIRVAFPCGIPASDEEKREATSWSEEQELELSELFALLEEQNGRVMNVLGTYSRRVGA